MSLQQQHNSQWHEWRRFGIGGSDAPVIMHGMHFGKTPYMLWQEKCLGIYLQKDSYAMKRGRDNEEAGREAFKELTGISVQKKDYIIHPEIDWLRCNLDGLDSSGEVAIEIKNAGADDHIVALNKMVPDKYIPQVEHIRLVMPTIKEVHYISLNKDFPVAHVVVKPDEAYNKELFAKEKEFWEHVLKGTPPELNEFDFVDMSGNKSYEKAANKIFALREQIKILEEQEEEYLNLMKSLSQGRSSRGFGATLHKQICDGPLDYKKMIEEHGIDKERFRKKSFEKWTLRYNQE